MKVRLDVLLADRRLFSSREKARAAIMAGLVSIDGTSAGVKPGMPVSRDVKVEIREDSCPFVSRGGLKLQSALKDFCIDLKDAVCIDVGASTGGFTDCMLQAGARLVYAIDVGYGQLDWKIRNDERVVNIERTNFRYLEEGTVAEKADFIAADVSFISLFHIFPVASPLLKAGGDMICLVKPQFEAGREQVGKHGIVRDEKVHAEVLTKVGNLGRENALKPVALTHSPIKGAKGNIEYLMLLKKEEDSRVSEGKPESESKDGADGACEGDFEYSEEISATVEKAFSLLGRPGE